MGLQSFRVRLVVYIVLSLLAMILPTVFYMIKSAKRGHNHNLRMREMMEMRAFTDQVMLLSEPLQEPTGVIKGRYTEEDYRDLLTVDHLEASGNWVFYTGLSASSSPGMSPVVISPILGEYRIVAYLNGAVSPLPVAEAQALIESHTGEKVEVPFIRP